MQTEGVEQRTALPQHRFQWRQTHPICASTMKSATDDISGLRHQLNCPIFMTSLKAPRHITWSSQKCWYDIQPCKYLHRLHTIMHCCSETPFCNEVSASVPVRTQNCRFHAYSHAIFSCNVSATKQFPREHVSNAKLTDAIECQRLHVLPFYGYESVLGNQAEVMR